MSITVTLTVWCDVCGNWWEPDGRTRAKPALAWAIKTHGFSRRRKNGKIVDICGA